MWTVQIMTGLSTAYRQLQQSLVELQQQVWVGAAANVLQLIRIFQQIVHLNVTLHKSQHRHHHHQLIRRPLLGLSGAVQYMHAQKKTNGNMLKTNMYYTYITHTQKTHTHTMSEIHHKNGEFCTV